MTSQLLSALMTLMLLLTWGPADQQLVEGGIASTPACITACLLGPCAYALAVCKYFQLVGGRGGGELL